MADKIEAIMGLDISTAVTGVSLLALDGSLLELMHVDTRKCEDLWSTADLINIEFLKLSAKYEVKHLYVEEDLQRFRKGFSSANTLSTLSKINGIVTYAARNAFKIEPVYIQSSAARKLCGVKIVKAKTDAERKDPLWVKQQVFEHMRLTCPDISIRQWPMTKPSIVNPSGHMRHECFDEVDAYVISRAAWQKTK